MLCLLQAGWKETHLQFATQLKNLTAQGVTEIGPALKNAFDMLNMKRNQSGIDTYGQVCLMCLDFCLIKVDLLGERYLEYLSGMVSAMHVRHSHYKVYSQSAKSSHIF